MAEFGYTLVYEIDTYFLFTGIGDGMGFKRFSALVIG
jgi:hypothetical protein